MLGERGTRLFEAFRDRVDERGLVLLEEAARIADRLDKLDRLLTGEADVWCRLVHNTRTEDYELKIDGEKLKGKLTSDLKGKKYDFDLEATREEKK